VALECHYFAIKNAFLPVTLQRMLPYITFPNRFGFHNAAIFNRRFGVMTGSDEHLKPLRLFDIARQSGPPLTEQERQHLRECDECKRIVETFARQKFNPPPDPADPKKSV
jgi:hypothetical protein